MHEALTYSSHRPWALPDQPWRWQQSWLNLAFIHYRVSPETLQRRLPAGLTLQTFAGTAWVGVVPFQMANVAPRQLASVARLPRFLELNVRTYVEADGKPGVWFFSLDANSSAIIFGGRRLYNLPYFPAKMKRTMDDKEQIFSSVRRGGRASFSARYRAEGPVFFAAPGSFAHWATERYCLYAHTLRRGLERLQVHHPPWPLQSAVVTVQDSTMLAAANIVASGEPPVCHFSTGVNVISYANEKVASFLAMSN